MCAFRERRLAGFVFGDLFDRVADQAAVAVEPGELVQDRRLQLVHMHGSFRVETLTDCGHVPMRDATDLLAQMITTSSIATRHDRPRRLRSQRQRPRRASRQRAILSP
jgi:hypothetical protein